MSNKIRPISALNGATMATQVRAVENQARITGAANNYSLQANVQKAQLENDETRKKKSQSLLSQKIAVGTIDALSAVDLNHHHDEEDGQSNGGRGRRRRRKKPPPPPSDL